MTIDELQTALDVEIARVVGALKERSDLPPIEFSGTVAGFLIKTGIAIAASNGCPNKTLRAHLNAAVVEGYAKARGGT